MAEVRITPEQLQEQVQYALKRISDRDLVITGPILVGIVAWPDGDRPDFRDIQALPRETPS
jgi:hypothetical protein